MRSSYLRLVLLSTPLALAACGDGWEAVKTDQYFPYGNQRTAGSGTAYVLAKMLPEKELKLETTETIEEPQEPEPSLEAEKIFNDAQTKGAPPSKGKSSIMEPTMDSLEEDIEGAALDQVDEAQTLLAQDLTTSIESTDEAEVTVSALEPSAGGLAPPPPQNVYPNRVIEPSHVISMPEDHIISPKMDVMEFKTEGQRSLDQIYKDDF